ncbi:MAG: hypothetical protein ACFCA4_05705 [Cyanophyceae cyanobacterium]
MADWLSWWEETAEAIAEVADQVQIQAVESVGQWFSQSTAATNHEIDQFTARLDENLTHLESSLDQWLDQTVLPLGQELDQAVEQTFDQWESLLQPWMAPFLNWHLDPQTMEAWEEAEQAVDEVMFGFLEYLGVDFEGEAESWNEEALWNEIAPKTQPSENWHSACKGCQNFHGRSYDGNLLICAMHPYGVEGDRCFDWTAANESQ